MTQLIQLIQNFLEHVKGTGEKPLIVILGPTASGKTNCSITLSKTFSGEVVSADSRQIYRYMDIGTDKVLPEAQEGIPHHLLSFLNPDERFTLADFKREAERLIEEILLRGRVPFLVGGTGLYINAITQNFLIPEGSENFELRRSLEYELQTRGKEFLYEKLKRLDPISAAKIHPHNIPYIIRAIEISVTTGRPKQNERGEAKYVSLKIGLSWPREKLYERIDYRVLEQIKRGLIDETKRLLQMGYHEHLPSMTSLGYRDLIPFLQGKISLEEATEQIKKNTREYAKRQLTWFRRDPEIVWVSGEEILQPSNV